MSDLRAMGRSRVVRATVFSDVAHVTRRTEGEVDGGVQRIALRAPRGLDPASIRVVPSRGIVLALEAETVLAEVDVTSDAAALRLASEALHAKVRKLGGELEAARYEISVIDGLRPTPVVLPGGVHAVAPFRPDVFLAGLDVVTERRRETMALVRRLGREHDETLKAWRELERRRDLVGETSGSSSSETLITTTLDLGSHEPGTVALDVEYAVSWATWRPYYHIRLSGGAPAVELVRFADLWQDTSENWEEIDLCLSTAQPETALEPPVLSPWSLGLQKSYEDGTSELYSTRNRSARFRPEPVVAGGPSDERGTEDSLSPPNESLGAGKVFDPYPDDSEGGVVHEEIPRQQRSELDAQALTARAIPKARGHKLQGALHERKPRKDGDYLDAVEPPQDACEGIDFEFEVPGRVGCRSGNDRQRLGLGSSSHPVAIEYLLRPALRSYAFRRATITHGDSAPLLAGPAGIFLDDVFFGETEIKTTERGGTLALDLGVEPAIKCARRTRTHVRTEGILKVEDVHVVEVTVEIENYLDASAPAELQDQIPLSSDPRVSVRLVRSTPADHVFDPVTGILTFRLELAASAHAEVKIVYEIQVPRDYQIEQSLGA
ncbi:MAG: DUF4139 domain-containing protein [Deltaproteobacteria bacterium]|nr:DUF4139 domain-containing protein [Deltaproteobacteria bacterium]